MNPIKIIWLVPFLLLAGCEEKKEVSRLSFGTNIESGYWAGSGSIVRFANAHSGNHVCKIDKQNPFTTIMDIQVRDISPKPLKKARITAWFMLTGEFSEQNLVLDVRDSTLQQSFEWINSDAADFVSGQNTWGKAELLVDLTVKNRNNPSNFYRIYASNGTDFPVYVDDIEVEFEE